MDFTMGAGSCGIACKKTNRNFYGIELNKEYYDIAEDRLYQMDIKEQEDQEELEAWNNSFINNNVDV
jgi:DNA modification methylase